MDYEDLRWTARQLVAGLTRRAVWRGAALTPAEVERQVRGGSHEREDGARLLTLAGPTTWILRPVMSLPWEVEVAAAVGRARRSNPVPEFYSSALDGGRLARGYGLLACAALLAVELYDARERGRCPEELRALASAVALSGLAGLDPEVLDPARRAALRVTVTAHGGGVIR